MTTSDQKPFAKRLVLPALYGVQHTLDYIADSLHGSDVLNYDALDIWSFRGWLGSWAGFFRAMFHDWLFHFAMTEAQMEEYAAYCRRMDDPMGEWHGENK